LNPVPAVTPVTSSQPGSSPWPLLTYTRRPAPKLDLVDLTDDRVEPSFLPAGLDPREPLAPLGARPAQDLAEELDALVERQPREGVDTDRLEQAARNVQVLSLRLWFRVSASTEPPASRMFAHSLTDATPAPSTM
jgi:hypothetical protein